jgi:hypothetical protein
VTKGEEKTSWSIFTITPRTISKQKCS